PRAGGDVGHRIELDAAERVLVADQGAVRRVGAIDARLPAGLPVHLVAAEEREVDTGVARRFDACALPRRPVLVVSDREERLRLQPADEIRSAAFGVDA